MDESAGLENRSMGNCTVGSNPTLSATLVSHALQWSLIYLKLVFKPMTFARFAFPWGVAKCQQAPHIMWEGVDGCG